MLIPKNLFTSHAEKLIYEYLKPTVYGGHEGCIMLTYYLGESKISGDEGKHLGKRVAMAMWYAGVYGEAKVTLMVHKYLGIDYNDSSIYGEGGTVTLLP